MAFGFRRSSVREKPPAPARNFSGFAAFVGDGSVFQMYLFLRAVGHQHGHTGKGTGIAGTACDDLEPADGRLFRGCLVNFQLRRRNGFCRRCCLFRFRHSVRAGCGVSSGSVSGCCISGSAAGCGTAAALAWEMMPFPVQMPAQCDRAASILPGILPGSFP